MQCSICHNSKGNTPHTVQEMMFGTKEPFTYIECTECGTVQLAEPPQDMSQYYPDTYYSLGAEPSAAYASSLRAFLERARTRYAVYHTGMIGKALFSRYPDGAPQSLSHIEDLHTDMRILDIGCGTGRLLYDLREIGFTHTTGTDPYLKAPIHYPNGLTILSSPIEAIEGTYDIIMMHHVFEHIAEPLAYLKEVSEKLSDTGTLIIRIPIADSEAWERYGVHWVQLDAPRHFFLHTVEGMHMLAEHAGLTIDSLVYDSRDFQFWGSEQYKQDMPLMDTRSLAVNPRSTLFTKKERNKWKLAAQVLNDTARGDQACFYLKKI
jgi:SAM-dependent methyltransferase